MVTFRNGLEVDEYMLHVISAEGLGQIPISGHGFR